ncbi:MAG: hypothetical protein A2172_04110 [Candidatus Woykebacteria bacterium RBG_13_40_15]|uniref:Sugar kinase n=1 Tax=Candidatus Woykebacteria bacterium RBG_13_40_15 TaxID=1802593 RepID=A0A1G1W6T4_9BACT|nr:MAG: hypothetical protein A2172_04110 [Candidatus Woykebacteria bacterium RBG_13_40_15]
MYIGIDIGGTHTRVASGAQGKIQQRLDFPTKEFKQGIQDIKEAVQKVSSEKIERVVIGLPGPIETKTGKLLEPPNLVGWDRVNVADTFSKILNAQVVVEHDVSVAALGESLYGAGAGKNPVLYITVSTGIGMGLVVDGKIYKGVYNPEAGEQILSKAGPTCSCGQESDLESLSAGSSLKRLTGKDPKDLVGSKAWTDAMDWLGIGITNSILHYSPEIVVIGGGLSEAGDRFFDPVRKSVKKHLKILPQVPIVPAALAPNSGLIGAITLAETSN